MDFILLGFFLLLGLPITLISAKSEFREKENGESEFIRTKTYFGMKGMRKEKKTAIYIIAVICLIWILFGVITEYILNIEIGLYPTAIIMLASFVIPYIIVKIKRR